MSRSSMSPSMSPSLPRSMSRSLGASRSRSRSRSEPRLAAPPAEAQGELIDQPKEELAPVVTCYGKLPTSDWLSLKAPKPMREFTLDAKGVHTMDKSRFHLTVSGRLSGIPVTPPPGLLWHNRKLMGQKDSSLRVEVAWCERTGCFLVRSTEDSGQGRGEYEIFFLGNMGADSKWFAGRVVCPFRPTVMEPLPTEPEAEP